jgi:hypothetical protein
MSICVSATNAWQEETQPVFVWLAVRLSLSFSLCILFYFSSVFLNLLYVSQHVFCLYLYASRFINIFFSLSFRLPFHYYLFFSVSLSTCLCVSMYLSPDVCVALPCSLSFLSFGFSITRSLYVSIFLGLF